MQRSIKKNFRSICFLVIGVTMSFGGVWVWTVKSSGLAAHKRLQGTGCVTETSGGGWQNTAISPQSGSFTAEFDAPPTASPIDCVVGMSRGAQTAYAGFATLARF